MLPITLYLIGNPLIAVGLALLILLCITSVLRRQVRSAIGLWVLILVCFLYVYLQAAALQEAGDESPAEASDQRLPAP